MSYDLHCYRPTSEVPDAGEAKTFIRQFATAREHGDYHDPYPELREKLAAALISNNPRLERFAFDYARIAERFRISEDQAHLRYQHAQLNPVGDDLLVQLEVYGNFVTITAPYGYTGDRADELFLRISTYLRIIRETGGMFAYDPQTRVAFDPTITTLNHEKYDQIAKTLPRLIAHAKTKA